MAELESILRNDKDMHFSLQWEGRDLVLSYEWQSLGRMNTLRSVTVLLTGMDPYTGEQLENVALARFSSAISRVKCRPAYTGQFTLVFRAELKDGSSLDFAREPISLAGPSLLLEYAVEPVEAGWSRLRVRSNCYKRLADQLWYVRAGHCQHLPPMTGENEDYYLPFQEGGQKISIYTTAPKGSALPTPERKERL